jgi:ABC-type nitrate/sulfonate/bicarbonate transport system ATPase subunit
LPVKLVAVEFRYPGQERPVIRDLSLTIEDGESVALMGPSGSGKSTALQLIGGLLRPTRGDIQYLRYCELVRDAPRIGCVFQTNNVLSRRSATDNAALGLLAGGMSHAPAERAYSMLQAMESAISPIER